MITNVCSHGLTCRATLSGVPQLKPPVKGNVCSGGFPAQKWFYVSAYKSVPRAEMIMVLERVF